LLGGRYEWRGITNLWEWISHVRSGLGGVCPSNFKSKFCEVTEGGFLPPFFISFTAHKLAHILPHLTTGRLHRLGSDYYENRYKGSGCSEHYPGGRENWVTAQSYNPSSSGCLGGETATTLLHHHIPIRNPLFTIFSALSSPESIKRGI